MINIVFVKPLMREIFLGINMRENTALVVYYTKLHKNSFNALIGALEIDEYFDNFPIYFANRKRHSSSSSIIT